MMENDQATNQPESPAPMSTMQRVGQFVFRFRDYMVPLVLAAVLVVTRPQAPFGSEALDSVLDVIGFLTALVGQILRMSVIGYAYIQRGGANKRLAAPRLVAEGFYAHSRNPMYVGNFLIVTGLMVIYNSFWAYVIVLPLFLFSVLSIIKAEETFLRGRFGEEYDAYCVRVNRFFPDLHGLRETLNGMTFDWRRVMRKEYGTTFAWLTGAFLFLIWERWWRIGDAESSEQIRTLFCAYLPIVAAWGGVRFLKKTGRLRSPD